MATTDFGKIALKSSAKMSLNDRFQLLRQTQLRRTQTNAVNTSNNTAIQLRQGSQRNKRLALQMANRPSVLSALRVNNSQGIKQRLGNQRFINRNNNNNNINNNRNNNNNINNNRNINVRNRNQKRLINRSNINTVALNRNRVNINRNRVNNRNQVRTQFQNRRNNSQNIGVIVGARQTARKAVKKNGFRLQSFKTANPAKASIKQRRRGIGGQFRNQTQTNKTGAKKLRINRNFNARNNGGQQQPQQQQKKRNVKNVKPDKQQLDNDLDAYMAGTKSYLDAELDAYMSQTN